MTLLYHNKKPMPYGLKEAEMKMTDIVDLFERTLGRDFLKDALIHGCGEHSFLRFAAELAKSDEFGELYIIETVYHPWEDLLPGEKGLDRDLRLFKGRPVTDPRTVIPERITDEDLLLFHTDSHYHSRENLSCGKIKAPIIAQMVPSASLVETFWLESANTDWNLYRIK